MAKNTKATSTKVSPDVQAKMTEKVNEKTELVKAWKEAFNDKYERDIRLSDNTIMMVIDRAGKRWDDMDDDGKLSLLEKAEETAKAVMVSDPGLSVLVKKLEADTQAMKEMDDSVDAIMRNKINKVRMYAQFRRIYTKAELDEMPYPGTDKDTSWLGNYRPDKVTKPTNAGDIDTVWSEDFVSTMAKGKFLEDRLDDLKKETVAENSSTYFKGWGMEALDAEKKNLTAQRNGYRALVRGAIEVHHCFEGINGMAQVHIHWSKTKHPEQYIAMPEKCGSANPIIKVTTSPNLVFICPQDGASLDYENGRTYTGSQLTAFDIHGAIVNGGTLAALKATVKKAAKGAAKSGEDGDGSSMDAEQAYSAFNRVTNYINTTANVAALRLIFADPKAEHHKDYLENVVTLGAYLDTVRKQFKKQIEAITETKMGKAEQDAA